MNQSDILYPISIDLDPFVLNTKKTIARFRFLWKLSRNRKKTPFNWAVNFILRIQDDKERERLCDLLECKKASNPLSLVLSAHEKNRYEQLYEQYESLSDAIIHYNGLINEIEDDRDLRLSGGHELLGYKRTLKKTEFKLEKVRKEITDIIDKTRNKITEIGNAY